MKQQDQNLIEIIQDNYKNDRYKQTRSMRASTLFRLLQGQLKKACNTKLANTRE
jgi:hypothetical protein